MAATDSDGSRPILTVVSGRPGAGKSTLGRKLADALGCPLVSRDELYDGMLQSMTLRLEPVVKEEAARLAFGAFRRLLAEHVAGNATVVAEAAFQHPRWSIVLEPLVALADVRVIRCEIDAEIARERLVQRYSSKTDADPSTVARGFELAAGDFEHLALPVPVLRVSTANGYDPSFDEIVAFVQSRR